MNWCVIWLGTLWAKLFGASPPAEQSVCSAFNGFCLRHHCFHGDESVWLRSHVGDIIFDLRQEYSNVDPKLLAESLEDILKTVPIKDSMARLQSDGVIYE